MKRTTITFKQKTPVSAMSVSIMQHAARDKALARREDRAYIRAIAARNARIVNAMMEDAFRSSLGI